MNMIQIAGHLAADPEVRHTTNGQKVTTFRVGVNSRRAGKDDTTWYRVTVWGDRFDKMISYLKKGSAVIVFGELQKPEIYTDKEGRQQISMEITADSIRFSPFGKPNTDQAQSSGGGFTQNNATASYGYTAPQENSFNNEPAYSQPKQNNYGSANSYGSAPQGNSNSSYKNVPMDDDEPMPF